MDLDNVPTEGSRWKHPNGALYTVSVVTNLGTTRPEDYVPTVVYFSQNDVWWSRPLTRWPGSLTLLPDQ